MIEAEWLACGAAKPMLEFLEENPADRKLRLFACAACRRVGRWLTDERSRAALETAELFADGRATADQLAASADAAWQAHLGLDLAAYYAGLGAHFAANESAAFAASEAADCAYGASVNDP